MPTFNTTWWRKLVRNFLVAVAFLGLAFLSHAQSAATSQPSKPVEGTLIVTATVVGSVAVVMGPNGEQTVIVANALDEVKQINWPVRAQTRRSTTKAPVTVQFAAKLTQLGR